MIGSLTHTTATMPDHVLKATILRAVRDIVPQMPLAHHAGRIPVFGKQVPQSLLGYVHHGPTCAGSVGAGDSRIISGHQSGSRRRAKGADVKIGETDGFVVQTIEVWCFQDWVAVATQISVALIIGHHQDDVGSGIPAPNRNFQKTKEQMAKQRFEIGLIHESYGEPVSFLA